NKLVGDHDTAIPAFERALDLLGPHARLLADLAESIAITQGGRFAGRPVELLRQALAVDPRDPRSEEHTSELQSRENLVCRLLLVPRTPPAPPRLPYTTLFRSNKLVGDHDTAIPAFERALDLLGPHARLLADLAESIAITQGGRFAGRPVELLRQALAVDPRDP